MQDELSIEISDKLRHMNGTYRGNNLKVQYTHHRFINPYFIYMKTKSMDNRKGHWRKSSIYHTCRWLDLHTKQLTNIWTHIAMFEFYI